MRKLFSPLAILATLFCIVIANPAAAATFQTSGELNVAVEGSTAMVSLTGPVAVVATHLIQFRVDPEKWTQKTAFDKGVARFDLAKGNTFQLLAADGKWLLLTPEMFGNAWSELKFTGAVAPDNSNAGGLKLKVVAQ